MRRGVLRALVGIGLVLVLGGPTPGAVGSCGEDSAPFADLAHYCRTRELLSCERRRLRGEFSGEEGPQIAFDACLFAATMTCGNRFWAPGCRPTVRQANACIAALQSYDTLQIEESELPECKVSALCTVDTLVDAGAMP